MVKYQEKKCHLNCVRASWIDTVNYC